jgi:hypothetical protein
MRLFVLLICLLPIGSLTAQQEYPLYAPEIITCFNIIDDKNKPLNLDGSQGSEILVKRIGDEPTRYTPTDLRLKKLENIYEPDGYLATQPMKIVPPFTKRFIYNITRSQRDLELLIMRSYDDHDDTMRIIFTGQNKSGNMKEPIAFVIEDIRFRKGSYILNCEKNIKQKKRINFNNFLPLDVYYIGNQLEIKQAFTVPLAVLKDYIITGFTLHENGTFDYEEYARYYPYPLIKGFGKYSFKKGVLYLNYLKAPRDSSVFITRDSNSAECCTITCQTFYDATYPSPRLSLLANGNNKWMSFYSGDTSMLRCTNEQFPLTIQTNEMGVPFLKIQLDKPGNYSIKWVLKQIEYVDSGKTQIGVITDFINDYIGIYWIETDIEKFSLPNQYQWDNRTIYYRRGVKRPVWKLPD